MKKLRSDAHADNPIVLCAIPRSHEQAMHADVLIQFVPMNACPVAGKLADYKEKVIDLLMRVTTVSVDTERITQAMQAAVR